MSTKQPASVGTPTDAPDAWVARYLRIASELAAHLGPVLGPELARRDQLGAPSTDGALAASFDDGPTALG